MGSAAVRGPTGDEDRPEDVRAVEEVSLAVHRGETLGLVGESGCGKSTLARACLRLQAAQAGRILLEGTDITHLSGSALRPLRARAQVGFQDPQASLNPRLAVAALVTEPAVIHGRVPRAGGPALARRLPGRVGLPRDSAPFRTSSRAGSGSGSASPARCRSGLR